jgi:hypothetical protein
MEIHWYLPASPYGVTIQKNNIVILTAVRTSNLTLSFCSPYFLPLFLCFYTTQVRVFAFERSVRILARYHLSLIWLFVVFLSLYTIIIQIGYKHLLRNVIYSLFIIIFPSHSVHLKDYRPIKILLHPLDTP